MTDVVVIDDYIVEHVVAIDPWMIVLHIQWKMKDLHCRHHSACLCNDGDHASTNDPVELVTLYLLMSQPYMMVLLLLQILSIFINLVQH
jgi:hypothetical protein